MSVFCEDKKLNLSPAYLKPGFAFGGSCLPKDLRALSYQAKRFDLDSHVLNSILASNESQVKRGIDMITGGGKKRLGFMGMAFKPGTDDLRESPLVTVIETLLGKGYPIRIYDQNVSASRLIGANREYMEKHIPHLASLLVPSVEELVSESDVIVIGYQSPEFESALKTLTPDQTVVDLARVSRAVSTPAEYEGICW
jgi:GDP-mannose 6-dehydrogenase